MCRTGGTIIAHGAAGALGSLALCALAIACVGCSSGFSQLDFAKFNAGGIDWTNRKEGPVSPGGRWRVVAVRDKGELDIRVVAIDSASAMTVVDNSARVVGVAWIMATGRAVLVVNDWYCSSHSRVFLADPSSGRLWRPDEQAIADFEATAPEGREYDRRCASVRAVSPGGARLVLGLAGQGGIPMHGPIQYVVVTDSGRIVRRAPMRFDANRARWVGEL
ncbi:MAG: hypothetical protein ACYSU0_18345 [Planctomycetota bacterium]|jgi:hypothetical protein